jgi:hypothetical protein
MKYLSSITRSIRKKKLIAFVRSRLKKKRIKSRRHITKYPITLDKIYKTSELHINSEPLHIHSEKENLDSHKTHTSRSSRLVASQKKQVPNFSGSYKIVHKGEDRCILVQIRGRDRLYCESSYDLSNFI